MFKIRTLHNESAPYHNLVFVTYLPGTELKDTIWASGWKMWKNIDGIGIRRQGEKITYISFRSGIKASSK